MSKSAIHILKQTMKSCFRIQPYINHELLTTKQIIYQNKQR